MFHSLSKFVSSLLAAVLNLPLTLTVEQSHVFNFRVAEKDPAFPVAGFTRRRLQIGTIPHALLRNS